MSLASTYVGPSWLALVLRNIFDFDPLGTVFTWSWCDPGPAFTTKPAFCVVVWFGLPVFRDEMTNFEAIWSGPPASTGELQMCLWKPRTTIQSALLELGVRSLLSFVSGQPVSLRCVSGYMKYRQTFTGESMGKITTIFCSCRNTCRLFFCFWTFVNFRGFSLCRPGAP